MTETIASADDGTLDWREFLTERPPGTRARVDRAAYLQKNTRSVTVRGPELQLYCDGRCQCFTFCQQTEGAIGRLFGGVQRNPPSQPVSPVGPDNLPYDTILGYTCEKCGRVVKSFSVRFWSIAASSEEADFADVQKIAEWPPFEPRTPGKVMSLVGPDRDLFLKGRRAEIEGLGVGAFSYYRRIIEGQKNRLLDEIIRVARHVGAAPETVALLDAAKVETQFKKAVESVKDAIPPALYIKGHNPLTLLHGALSEGLHNASDEQCLLAANDIRLILFEFAERLTEAMKGQKELDEALSRLVNRKN
jgi:hypothetical protein